METQPALNSPPPPAPRKKAALWRFFLAGLLALAFVFYFFQPSLAAWWLRQILTQKAKSQAWLLTMGSVEADFFTGQVMLKNLLLIDERSSANQMQGETVEIDFSPWRLLFQKNRSPVRKIILSNGRIDWKWLTLKSSEAGKKLAGSSRNYFPETLLAREISARLECGNTKVQLQSADGNFLPDIAGAIHLPTLDVASGSWTRHFTNLEGVTAIKERGLYIGGVRLGEDVVLERGAVNFNQPGRGTITSDLQFSAFGGQWRTDLAFELQKTPVKMEAGISFWNLSVDQLGNFLGNRDFAEGTLHEGRLTFRGSPLEPAKSNLSLRLNATDFRWQERRWNSLIFSMLLVNRRLEIPQFELVQDKNQIKLNGNAALGGKWTLLPDEFQLQVVAQIDDLGAAAKILFPEQKLVEGEAFFAGEVRSQKKLFSGNLKMRGGPLKISGIAVDRVRGDLDLHGSEVKATALEFVRREDTATGWATLDLAEPRRYSGEFEVKAGDVRDYVVILPKAVSDHAVAGGVNLWWSGDGTTAAHSGAFKLALDDFLLSREKTAVPLDISSNGSYSPAGLTLNQLSLERPATKLETAVVVRPDSLELRDLRITGSGGSMVSGNITLPLNLFSAAYDPTLGALFDSGAAASGQLIGSKVRLEELGELLGRRPLLRGRTTFDFQAEGALQNLRAKLDLTLSDFYAPENITVSAIKAEASLTENHLSLQANINPDESRDSLNLKLEGTTALSRENLVKSLWLDAAKEIVGTLKFNRLNLTQLHPLVVESRPYAGDASGSLTFRGLPPAPAWEGQITLQQTSWQPTWLDYSLQKLNGDISLLDGRFSTEKITGNYRGGAFTASGSAGWNPAENVDLAIEGKSLTLSSQSDLSEAVVDGAVRLQGPAASRNLSGNILVKTAILHRELSLRPTLMDLPATDHFLLPWVPSEWTLDLSIKATQPLEIRGKDRTWLLQPDVLTSGSSQNPRLMGQLTLSSFASFEQVHLDAVVFYYLDTTLENGREIPPLRNFPVPADQWMSTTTFPLPAFRRLNISPTILQRVE